MKGGVRWRRSPMGKRIFSNELQENAEAVALKCSMRTARRLRSGISWKVASRRMYWPHRE